jgi:hypothetical protein
MMKPPALVNEDRWRQAVEDAAAIESRTGSVTVYRKNNKPAFGPVGDSVDDIDLPGWRQ